MKTIITVMMGFLFIVVMSSITSSCAEKRKSSRTKTTGVKRYFERVDFENHTYIISHGGYHMGMVHDPDCKCKR